MERDVEADKRGEEKRPPFNGGYKPIFPIVCGACRQQLFAPFDPILKNYLHSGGDPFVVKCPKCGMSSAFDFDAMPWLKQAATTVCAARKKLGLTEPSKKPKDLADVQTV